MFPQFGSTAETLSKASTMVFRIGTDAHLYDDPEDVNIAPLLDSKFDSEKCEALKRLLALVAQGFDVSNFFPQVVKNVASQSLEVKKLVYLYLLHYAEKRPNEALLSINCFQKDLGDPNPLVRAWALRTMAGIRLHVISPLVLVAVRKCARDPSVYVRKCAATALPKLHDLRQEENASAIEEIVQILLNDSSPAVVGAAGAAFASVCPSNLSLIGRNYQRLCEILPDVEEWGQIILIGILLRCVIARYGFAKESIMHSLHCENLPLGMNGATNDISSAEDGNDSNRFVETELTDMVARCYIEGPDEYLSRSSYKNEASQSLNSEYFVCARENNDIKILLQCTSPLLWNNNSAVVLAAAGVHWVMAPRESIEKIVKPLLFLVRSANASKYVVLCNIQVFARAMPSLFAPYFKDFFIFSSDSHQVKAVKLEILSSIATSSSISSIFSEFQDYIRDPDRRFAAGTVAAIGLCAQRLPEMANIFLDSLLLLTRQEFLSGGFVSLDEEAGILIQAITSINLIIREDPSSYEKILIQLIRGLDSIKLPAARAMIIWMVGEYNSLGDTIPRMLPIVVKYLARHFTAEELEAKLQILNTMTKVFLCAKEEDVLTFKTVLDYLFELALCDLNYDLRDRARFLKKLLLSHLDIGVTKEEKTGDPFLMLAEGILKRQTKPASPEPMNYRFYLPGSLSQIVLHAAPGYEPLPKPCTLLQVIDSLGEGATSNVPYEADDLDSLSGSLDEESASDYTSQNSERGSYGSDGSNEADNPSEKGDNNADPLIQLSDVSNPHRTGNAQSRNADTGALMSKNALESWLDEQPGLGSLSISEQTQVHISSARISIGDIAEQVKPKSYRLLDPAYGNGLKVEYSFSSQVSNISPLLVCIEVSFRNCTTEPMSDITLVQEESNKVSDSMDQDLSAGESSLTSNNNEPTSVTMEGISSLEPDQTINRILQVRFNHHLLPLKLDLYCNGKRHPVKLRPDIGYFVKPLHMDSEAFTKMEKDLPGMFEYRRICTFTDHIAKQNEDRGDIGQLVEDTFLVICKSLALKILSNANIYLVSVDLPVAAGLQDASGLFLRFSGEILSNSIPCLITITVEEGRCSEPLTLSVKVNCEETVFSLNLLNRVVNFLVEPPLTNS